MKVKVKDVRPNPYRNIDHYPLNKEKIMALTSSIEKTGFWDNLVGREVNGEIQIAYGHHRIEALRLAQGYGYDFEFDLPIKDIDNGTMIQIMANENMQEWTHSVGVVDETVKVARDFLKSHGSFDRPIEIEDVKDFLGWTTSKVHNSWNRLSAIESGKVSQKAIESFGSEKKATKFTSAMKGKDFTKKEQEQIADELVRDDVSRDNIKNTIEVKAFEKKYPQHSKESKKVLGATRKDKVMSFDKWISDTKHEFDKINDILKDLDTHKNTLKDVSNEDILNRASCVLAITKTQNLSTELLEFLKQ